jgi:hypothetical protein
VSGGAAVTGHDREEPRPLAAGDRAWAEQQFGESFADVRVLDGAAGARVADDHAARALTHGRTVVLGRPPTDRWGGRALERAVLAHELAHVVQQSAPGTAAPSALERDADVAAGRAVLGQGRARPALRGGLRLQRCATVESMSEEDLAAYIDANHFRVVVTQETDRFLTGMKKSVAVAANPKPDVGQPVRQPDDELIVGGGGYPFLAGVLVEIPSDAGRWTRPSALHQPTGTFTWHLTHPGRYQLTAQVLFKPGVARTFTRSIEVEQADFAGASTAAAGEHLAGQPSHGPDVERLTLLLQRAELRERAVAAGVLERRVADAWTALSVAVVARAAALQDTAAEAGTATAVQDAASAFTGAFSAVPESLAGPIAVLRSRAFSTSSDRLRSAVEVLSRAFDTWVHGRLQEQPAGAELAKAFEYGVAVEREVAAIERRAVGGAVRIPAIFHPEAAYVRRELFVSGPVNLGRVVSVPLNLWLFSEGGRDWTLRDVSNPKETFEYDTDDDDRDAALDRLLGQLANDEERFPTGRLYVQPPGRERRDYAVESDMDPLDWLGVAALILAAAGIIMVTAGAATPGVVAAGGALLTTSAVVGAGVAIADTVDAYERGRLTGKRLALNALQVVASIATAGTSTLFTSAARQGTSALARVGTSPRYLLLSRTAAGADVAQLLVMGGDTAIQLAGLAAAGPGDQQAAMRAALAMGQLLAQGTLTVVSARDSFRGDLSTHPPIELHETADGLLVVRNVGAGAPGATATGPRVLEDLLDSSGRRFAAGHQTLQDAYAKHVARRRARGEEPLAPMDWAKHNTSGPVAAYLDGALPQGWRAARRGAYPGSRPHLIDRPSRAPAEGSIDPATGQRWRHRVVRVDEIRPEIDEVGEPWWTFPDLQAGEVLILPSGTRVWQERVPGSTAFAIVEEHPVSESLTRHRERTAGEGTIMSRVDMGPQHQAAGTERAHGAGSPGLGFDSPYGVAHAPPRVNQILENHGIEAYLRNLRDNAPPGVTYLYTTKTFRSGVNLQQRVYDIAAIEGGAIHPMYQFRIELSGGMADANVRFVTDEISVFSGADRFGSPKLTSQPAGGTQAAGEVGVDIPKVLREEMGRAKRVDPTPDWMLTQPLERSRAMRGRLDDLLEARIKAATVDPGLLAPAWMQAHDAARDALQRAETRLLNATVCGVDVAEFERMLVSMARTAGRHPNSVTAERLRAFARRVDALQLD